MKADVEVVVVHYKAPALVAATVERLVAAGWRTIVVDNSGEYRGPGRVLGADTNLGFGAACNLAVDARSDGTNAFLFHNPDVHCSDLDLERLLARLVGQRRPGLVAPVITSGGVTYPHGFAYPTLPREVVVSLGELYPAVRRILDRTRGQPGPEHSERRFGSGALLAASLEALTAVGGFDDRYFLYCEDLDLWHRVAMAGHEVEFAPDVVADHDVSTGSQMVSFEREVLRWVGLELFIALHEPPWSPYRRAHRTLMEVARSTRATDRTEVVRDLWRSGGEPVEVAVEIARRFRLEEGLAA